MDIALPNRKQSNKDAIPFSEALEKTGFGIFNYILIMLGGLLLCVTLFECASIGFILPIAECDLELTNKDKGILTIVGYIGIIVSSHLWGFLADTKGRRFVIMPTIFISSTISVLSSFSNQFWMFALLRFLNGFFVSGSSATVYAYIGEFHIGRTRTRAVLASSCFLSLGGIILPIIAWAIINQSWTLPLPFIGIVYKPWRLFIAACTSSGFIAGIILLVYPESPKFLMSIGKNEEALKVLRKMYSWNVRDGNFKVREIIPEEDIKIGNGSENSLKSSSLLTSFLQTMWRQTMPLFRKNLLLSTAIACTIQFCIYITMHGMFMWFPFISHNMVEFRNNNPGNSSRICDVINAKIQFEDNSQKIDGVKHCTEKLENGTFLLTMLMEFVYGLGFIVVGFVLQVVKKVHILFFILFAFGTCGILINFIYDTTLALVVYNMLFLCGVGIQVLSEIVVDLYPTNLRAMALCISLMFGRLGGVFGAYMIALLLATNCEMTFNIAGMGLVVSAFLTFLIPKVKNLENKPVVG